MGTIVISVMVIIIALGSLVYFHYHDKKRSRKVE